MKKSSVIFYTSTYSLHSYHRFTISAFPDFLWQFSYVCASYIYVTFLLRIIFFTVCSMYFGNTILTN